MREEKPMLNEDMVYAALKNVVDPEIGLDIVNLGLVYRVDVLEGGKVVDIDMTLTTPNCPAGPQILGHARNEVMALGDVYKTLEDVKINLVWTPFWKPDMMSEDAKDELGFGEW
jgi:metal-sulfur cluster biosynthetic enzyme